MQDTDYESYSVDFRHAVDFRHVTSRISCQWVIFRARTVIFRVIGVLHDTRNHFSDTRNIHLSVIKKNPRGKNLPGRTRPKKFLERRPESSTFDRVTSETDTRAPNGVQTSRFQKPIKQNLNFYSNQSDHSYVTHRVSELRTW